MPTQEVADSEQRQPDAPEQNRAGLGNSVIQKQVVAALGNRLRAAGRIEELARVEQKP